jgi:pyrophosphatase PpaX
VESYGEALVMTDAVIFDWDGTLLASQEALLRAWHTATEEVVGERYPATPEERDLVFTLPGATLFPRVAGDAERAADLAAAFQRAYARASILVRPSPGAVECVQALTEAGVGVGVVTSKARHRYDADAARTGLDSMIDVAVCDGEASAHKPDPAPVLEALARLDARPERSVMVGDTPVDIEAGVGAGITSIGVGWGASTRSQLLDAGAAAVVHDAEELLALVLNGESPGDVASVTEP